MLLKMSHNYDNYYNVNEEIIDNNELFKNNFLNNNQNQDFVKDEIEFNKEIKNNNIHNDSLDFYDLNKNKENIQNQGKINLNI